MNVNTVIYRNFRNIEEARLTFTPGVNILWGNNAQGKTNALEGIYCFACGKSFRGVRDRELLRFGAESGGLELSFTDARREQHLSLQLFQSKSRQMKKNGVPVRKSSDFVGTFHGVLFCPEHLSMIKGAPQLRRAFLDAAISQLRPAYLAALTDYAAVLKQRNALLKNEEQDERVRMPLYEVLTSQMAELNTRIVLTRMKYIRLLDTSVSGFLEDMTGGRERASLAYQSDAQPELYGEAGAEISRAFYEKCMSYAHREFAAQTTLHGCHRDDILISLDGREARLYASQGQDRSIALAMKLGEGELSRAATGEYPVFLFDDVLSELDTGRQQYLMQRLGGRQVIMTSCNESLFSGMDVNMIHVDEGCYEMACPVLHPGQGQEEQEAAVE
ncbi:MAG: DNA replication/repair protein RecF [Ruminococcaceae bacterium]|nr:DNA replication/repair protein RecF [Oscillospiraceae bacterium]